MNGIFNTLFRLKLKTSRDPLEDYLTEIFAHCLRNNNKVWDEFIRAYLPDLKEELLSLRTQLSFQSLEGHISGSKPDMIAFTENGAIFIENKIASLEGNKQLRRYADHLKSQKSKHKKYLIYITRDHDPKDEKELDSRPTEHFQFIQIRWYELFNTLKKIDGDQIVNEMLLFMNQINIAMNNQFSPADLITLSNFVNVKKMMDESMGGKVNEYFSRFGKNKKETVSGGSFDHVGRYILKIQGGNMWIGLGFWLESNEPREYLEVKVQIEISDKAADWAAKASSLQTISSNMEGWGTYNLNVPKSWAGIYRAKSLQQIISTEDHIAEIQRFFLDALSDVEKMRAQHPELPWLN
jgi:hypothetical protein